MGAETVSVPGQVPALAVLLLAAVVLRVGAEPSPDHFFTLIALASYCFLVATVLWATLVLPALVPSTRAR